MKEQALPADEDVRLVSSTTPPCARREDEERTFRVGRREVDCVARLYGVAVLDLVVRLVERKVFDARVEVFLAQQLLDRDMDDVRVGDVVAAARDKGSVSGWTKRGECSARRTGCRQTTGAAPRSACGGTRPSYARARRGRHCRAGPCSPSTRADRGRGSLSGPARSACATQESSLRVSKG